MPDTVLRANNKCQQAITAIRAQLEMFTFFGLRVFVIFVLSFDGFRRHRPTPSNLSSSKMFCPFNYDSILVCLAIRKRND